MADKKQRFAVLSRFEKLCKINNIQLPTMNKYSEQWAVDALLESFELDQLYSMLEYYFKVNARPTWKGFANNADRLLQSMLDKEEDDRLRAERRKQAKEWLNG